MNSVTSSPSLLDQYSLVFSKSKERYRQAGSLFPNGVTHDLRYLQPFPIYVDRAEGAYKWDVDGHQLIDYWSGHGALLLGHSHPDVVAAVQQQMQRATHPGACHDLELEWGRWVQRLIRSAETLRFVASGTEATLMAVRLARIHTGRPKLLKFTGHFHGWNDYVLPAADLPYDGAPVLGVPPSVSEYTVVVPPNDLDIVERTLRDNEDIGCVILEPTGGHFGQVPVTPEFLAGLRAITSRLERVLIFDEVITGFRVHPGGVQGMTGVTPDLTTLAKILAGGLPGGCVAGRADILRAFEFERGKEKMRHPGTFNANPLSAAAGCATLRHAATGEPQRRANESARLLRNRLNDMFQEEKRPWVAYGGFSDWKLIPNYDGEPPHGDAWVPYGGDWRKFAQSNNRDLMYRFRCGMLLHGVDVPGLGGMTTAAHTKADVENTVEAFAKTSHVLADEGLM